MNAARPFPHWKSSDNAICGSINDCDIARAFVADEHEVAWRFSARRDGEKNPKHPRDKKAMHMGDAYVSIAGEATAFPLTL